MTEATQPANWYTDPTGRHQYRYWNGAEWTDQVADNQVTSTDPPVMPTGSASPAGAATPAPAPTPGVVPPAVVTAKAPTRRGNALWAWIGCGGALLLIIGSFLDAATASFGGANESAKSYIDGDGAITLALGLAIVVVAVLVGVGVIPRWGGWVIAALGALGALVAIVDLVDVQDDIDTIKDLGGDASIGPALWLCLVGGVVAVACGVLVFTTAKADSA